MVNIASALTSREDVLIYEIPAEENASRFSWQKNLTVSNGMFLPCASYQRNGKPRLMYFRHGRRPLTDFCSSAEVEALTMVKALFHTAEEIAGAGTAVSSRAVVDPAYIFWHYGDTYCGFLFAPGFDVGADEEAFDVALVRLLTKMLTEWEAFSNFRSYVRLSGANACSLGETFDLLNRYSVNPSEALRTAALSSNREHHSSVQRENWESFTVQKTEEDEREKHYLGANNSNPTVRSSSYDNIGATVMAEEESETEEEELIQVSVQNIQTGSSNASVTSHRSETIMDTQMFFDGKSEEKEDEVPPAGRQVPPRYRLESTNPRNRISFAISAEGMTLGRSSEVDNVSSAFLSKFVYIGGKHCRLFFEKDTLYVEDLSSRNGTFLNGEKVLPEKPQELAEGDILRLANIELKLVRG